MLSEKYDYKVSESKWQKYWIDEEIYKFNRNDLSKVYSVDTPPPTISGNIHIGHIFSYTQTEIITRYKRMMGYNVLYPFGFDDNGLPTERFVEKTYDVKAYNMSREEFSALCLKTTSELELKFKDLFISMGFGVDWDYMYSTISQKAIKTSQASFLDLYNKNLAYHKEAPALWCTECATSVAQAEIDNKELPSIFNYLKFYLSDSDEYIEIATTRPEYLPACVSIFIHPDDEKNKYLLGKKVKVPLFDFEVEVRSDDKVDMDKGTGIVMCCTFGDVTDMEWYKKHNLAYKEVITQYGRMTDLAGIYANLTIKQARAKIIEDLISNGYMIKQDEIVHNVQTHERCGTPIEIIIKKQWFIELLKHKDMFLDAANKINWYPSFMKSRYDNWVTNLEWDWGISRQRYFGVPIPVWYCKKCSNVLVPDIEDLPINPLKDKPKNACSCGCKEFEIEHDVLDTWATSSLTQLINTDWIDDKKFNKAMIPMSLRPNAHDIIRTWDFYTIVKNMYHMNEIPWKDVMISGFVLASPKEKISKSKSNSKIDPYTVISENSSDVTRYWTASGSLGNDIIFDDEEFKNGKRLVNKIWNASKFVLMHLNDFNNLEELEILPMDQYIIALYNEMHTKFISYLEKYEIGLALKILEEFFFNFCDNYIEIVKNRLYKPEIYGFDKRKSGQYASYRVLYEMMKCFSIYLPHITEEIYKSFFEEYEKVKSIHLTNISSINIDLDNDIVKNGNQVIDIIFKVRKYKSENNVSIKEEIENMVISCKDYSFIKKIEYDLKSTLSIKNIEYKESDELELDITLTNKEE